MRPNRVLVVHKVSLLRRLGRREARAASAPRRARWIRSDAENRAAITEVIRVLMRSGWRVDVRPRGERLPRGPFDVVVVVGGDGTLFDTARQFTGTPFVVVNSDPPHSLALFSCGAARDFAARIDDLRAGRLKPTRINRMVVRARGKTLPPVMNDVLFAHHDPAAMSRYEIEVDGRRERQRSSGVWVSTAAGSTAAMLACGGRLMPIADRRLQVRAREAYVNNGRPYRLAHALASRRVTLVPLDSGMDIWMDGNRHRVALEPDEPVTIDTPGPPITVLGYDDRRRRRIFAHRER